jgi:hypothetical protein
MRSYTRGKEPGGHHNIDLVMGRSRCGSSPRTVAWWWHDDGVGRLHWTGGTGDASGSFSEVLWTSLTCSQGRRKDCESQRWRPLGQKMGDAMSPQVKKDLADEGGGGGPRTLGLSFNLHTVEVGRAQPIGPGAWRVLALPLNEANGRRSTEARQ